MYQFSKLNGLNFSTLDFFINTIKVPFPEDFLLKKIWYRRSPHFVIFGTKRVSRNSGITNFETLFITKSQIGPNNFLKSTFLAIFLVDYLVFFEIFMSSWKKSWKKGVKKVNLVKGLHNIAKKNILIKKIVRLLV